jgi:hypothetical protein
MGRQTPEEKLDGYRSLNFLKRVHQEPACVTVCLKGRLLQERAGQRRTLDVLARCQTSWILHTGLLYEDETLYSDFLTLVNTNTCLYS